MAALFFIPFAAAFLLTIVMRPEIIPDDLPPLPVVQAMATVALLVINIAIAASGLALAQAASCWAEILFFTLPSFVAIASLLTAVVLLFPRRKGVKGNAVLPYALGDTIAFFDQLSGSADRLGFRRVDYALVDDHGPGLEVAGDRTRGVTVFVRRWLVNALLHQLPPNVHASAPLLVRFAVQHEICHALNGDHHLYRAARAVAFGQIWWLAGAAGLILLVASPWPSPETRPPSALPLVWLVGALGLIATACALHRRLAKAFVLRYEIRADSRALAMLAPAERVELLDGAPTTRIAKFLAFLECMRPAHRAPFMARLLRLVWPAQPEASARLAGQPGPETRRDEKWALFGGLFAGVVLMSIIVAFHEVLEGATMWTALAVAMPIPNAYFVVRSRRAILAGDAGQADLSRRILAALGFLAGLIISTVLSVFYFAAPLTAWPSASTSMKGLMGFELLIWVAVTIVCLMTTTGGGNLTTAVETSFESWMTLIPLLFGCVFAAPLVGVVLATWQKLWETPTGAISPAMLAGFAGWMTSQFVWQAKSRLHWLAPFALLDSCFPIFRYRVFWRNVHVDAARHSRIGSLALATAIAGIMLAVPALVAVVAATLVFPGRALEALFGGSLLYLVVLVLLARRKTEKPPPIADDLIRLAARFLRLADLDPSIVSRDLELLRTRVRDALRRHVIQPPPGDETSVPADIRRAAIVAELAYSSGANEMIPEWQPRFAGLLDRFSDGNGVVFWPQGGPPSLIFTAWAYCLARLTNLAPVEAMERRLATIESMAIDAARRAYPSISETALVAGILREERRLDRDLAEAWSRLVSLDSIRPLQSITDLHAIAAALNREPLMVRLRAITRSKLWETLQLNAVSEMDRLMDLYETALRLPLNDERLLEIARRAVRYSMPQLTEAIG